MVASALQDWELKTPEGMPAAEAIESPRLMFEWAQDDVINAALKVAAARLREPTSSNAGSIAGEKAKADKQFQKALREVEASRVQLRERVAMQGDA